GPTNSNVERIIKTLGIDYSRVATTSGNFDIPVNFLQWEATCHHNDNLLKYGEQFLSQTPYELMLMYVYGHSFEFNGDDNWSLMEEFCRKMGRRDDIWYATNIEVCDYVNAIRHLRFTSKCDAVLNQSAYDVWISVDGEAVEIKSGAIVKF
ncbi:MAG: polysaccharide deacetylase, partial [Oscillospiraceae bacterium]